MYSELRYCQDFFSFSRHDTREIMAGNVGVGGANPVRIQSIIKSDISSPDACVKEIVTLAQKKGCEILRIKIESIEQAQKLQMISQNLH